MERAAFEEEQINRIARRARADIETQEHAAISANKNPIFRWYS